MKSEKGRVLGKIELVWVIWVMGKGEISPEETKKGFDFVVETKNENGKIDFAFAVLCPLGEKVKQYRS